MPREYHVYIVSNHSRRLYTGVTNDLQRRIWEHKTAFVDGFTARYIFDRLVYYETFEDVKQAIAREKQIKGWRREKKLELIESVNLGWLDLSDGWFPEEEVAAARAENKARHG